MDIIGSDPYAIVAAWLCGFSVGTALMGWVLVRRDREQAERIARARRYGWREH